MGAPAYETGCDGQNTLNRNTSTYLDCARFLAAFTVMLCHVDSYMVIGLIPWVDHLGLESVGVFFVLSGFVIGYATEFREKDLRTYAINRAARIYSVVIPCLAATLILDTFGHHFLFDVLYDRERFVHEAAHIAFSITFLNNSWWLSHTIQPGNDGPFWSLCYEVPFYAMFGTFWFLRGFLRWLVPVIIVLLTGPDVLTCFPIWLLGLGLYHLFRGIEPKPFTARVILLLSALLFAGFEALLRYFDLCPDPSANIGAANTLIYGGGVCFAVSLVGFRFSGLGLGRIADPMRWLAGATFTLYLLHFPLAWFLNGVMLASPIGNWPASLRFALLIAITFALALALAQVTERRKHAWRLGIERALAAAGQIFGGSAELKAEGENEPLS